MLRYWPKHWLRRGQIVLIQPGVENSFSLQEPSTLFIKRLAALPGETIRISPDYPLLLEQISQQQQGDHEKRLWVIPADHLFVLGDNLELSADSRTWGPISIQSLRGVKLLKLHGFLPKSYDEQSSNLFLTLQPSFSIGLSPGQPAPHFVAQTLNDEHVTLENFLGKRVALIFFAPAQFCCEAVITCFEFADQALQVGISMVFVSSTGRGPTSEFIKDLQIALPVLVAPRASNPFLRDYHITGTPAYCLLDEHGIVVSVGSLATHNLDRHELLSHWIVPERDQDEHGFPQENRECSNTGLPI